MQLRIINDKKVDHPRNGSKDLADAVAGAVSNAVSRTPRNTITEVEVYTRPTRKHDEESEPEPDPIPSDIMNWLSDMEVL